MSDFALLLRLRLHHAWSRTVWWAATVGADLRSKTLTDRAYVAYLALLLGGWSYLMIGVAVDRTFEAAAVVGAQPLTAAVLPWVSAALAVAYVIAGVRTAPVKFGYADMAYVAATPVSRPAIVAAWFTTGVPVTALGGGVLGLLAGVAASGAPDPVAAVRAAVSTALWMSAAILVARALGWAAGLIRHGGTDMTRITEASSAYAQFEVYRPLILYDAAAASDIRRRIRLAARPPRGGLPPWQGAGALVARAVTGHVRQPSTLGGPLQLGGVIVPLGMTLIATGQHMVTLLSWLFIVVASNRRGMIRIHEASAERPWLNHLLPYDELVRLALHSAPAVIIALITAGAITSAIVGLTDSTPLLIILAMALVVVLTLCQGLSVTIVPPLSKPIDYPASALITSAVIMAATYTEGVNAGLVTAAGCALLLALGIRTGES